MTTQDKNKWSIKIGRGFGKIGLKKYPQDRLSAFLNFKPKTKNEAGKFCSKYQIIPQGLDLDKDNILDAIRAEQQLLYPIANKIASGKPLTDNETFNINKRIGNIRKSLTQLSSEELNETNQTLSLQTELPEGEYVVDTFTHSNSTVSLWEDLANALVNRDLETCINCGGFYRPTSKHKRKYCTPDCASVYRQRKHRNK